MGNWMDGAGRTVAENAADSAHRAQKSANSLEQRVVVLENILAANGLLKPVEPPHPNGPFTAQAWRRYEELCRIYEAGVYTPHKEKQGK